MADELVKKLEKQELETEPFVEQLDLDKNIIETLLEGLTSENEVFRFNCSKVLGTVAEKAPEHVYPFWYDLVQLLSSPNIYHRCAAINILPSLIPVDSENNFELLFDLYFLLLDDRSVIPPCYVARNAVRIVSMKPEWRPRVLEKLLCIEQTQHETARKDLIKADIIEALDQLFSGKADAETTRFVKNQLNCSSPKTRKAAQKFLENHGDES